MTKSIIKNLCVYVVNIRCQLDVFWNQKRPLYPYKDLFCAAKVADTLLDAPKVAAAIPYSMRRPSAQALAMARLMQKEPSPVHLQNEMWEVGGWKWE